MITVRDDIVTVDTRTLVATFERGHLIQLANKINGEVYRGAADTSASALQLTYPGQGVAPVLNELAGSLAVIRLSDQHVQYRFGGWDGDGVLDIREDLANGDVVVEPSAYSSRTGLLSVRWPVALAPTLDLVAPFFQGVRVRPDDPLVQRRWAWPMFWEAGLLILQGAVGGFWVHCRDDRYRCKAVTFEAGTPYLETEAYGPLSNSREAGGLAWRINVHHGPWESPAATYRAWLHSAYHLDKASAARPDWVSDVRFAVSWYSGDEATLDALAAKLPPSSVLLHYAPWRTDAYDENYPTYEPSTQAVGVFAKARDMGFHIMPHCNSVDMDPTHPAYNAIRDFQYRDVATRGLHGWGWDPESNRVLGVPNSYQSLATNRRRKVMIKVHPGSSMWRSILCEQVSQAARRLGTDTVFIDVTLCTGNLDNCLVENTTSMEGMNRLIREMALLGDGLAVGGEGLNEITMQWLSFAQAHLFDSHQTTRPGLERMGGCALNDFLFRGLCRTFGYSGLSGANADSELRMRIHEEHNAIPTVTIGSASEITNPNPAVRRAIAMAAGQAG